MTRAGLVLRGYRPRPRWARSLRSWDVVADPGSVVHLRAANGAGKSTYLAGVVGLLPARWQQRTLHGVALDDGPARIRYVSARRSLTPGWRVADESTVVAKATGLRDADVGAALRHWGLDPLAGRWGDHLSLGQQRSVVLAVALAGRPGLVVLDEPTTGLDDEHAALLVDRLRAVVDAGAVVVIASHDASLLTDLPGTVLS